jgi:hypothetical protein
MRASVTSRLAQSASEIADSVGAIAKIALGVRGMRARKCTGKGSDDHSNK